MLTADLIRKAQKLLERSAIKPMADGNYIVQSRFTNRIPRKLKKRLSQQGIYFYKVR